MNLTNNLYNSNVIKKPWGEEYVIYHNKKNFAVTYLTIKPGKETSLHSHSKKKTGFIILSGLAKVQIGIYKKNTFLYKSMSRLVFREGLFHKLKNVGKKNLYALEFETPYIKQDLIRIEDNYGRSNKKYEGKKFFSKLTNNHIQFKKPNKFKNIYKLNNRKIYIYYIKRNEDISSKGSRSSIVILNGKIIDKYNQAVIKTGEIIKAKTLKILSKKFQIKNKILILEVP